MKLHPVSGETRSVPLRKNRAQLLLKIYIIIRMNDHTAEVVTDIYQDISDFFMISQICTHKKRFQQAVCRQRPGLRWALKHLLISVYPFKVRLSTLQILYLRGCVGSNFFLRYCKSYTNKNKGFPCKQHAGKLSNCANTGKPFDKYYIHKRTGCQQE